MKLHFRKLYYLDVLAKVSSCSGFIPTMQLVEKQHDSELKTLIQSSVLI